jgi:hypothetical protein
MVVAAIRTSTGKNIVREFRVRSIIDPFSGIFFYSFSDTAAPIVALVKPRTLERKGVYLKHFIINFFESNASNRIDEMDSADKNGTVALLPSPGRPPFRNPLTQTHGESIVIVMTNSSPPASRRRNWIALKPQMCRF